MKTDVDWSDGRAIARAFKWLEKNRVGCQRGRPIGWYQIHQCHTLDILKEKMGGHGELLMDGEKVIGRRHGDTEWKTLGTRTEIYDLADKRSRK